MFFGMITSKIHRRVRMTQYANGYVNICIYIYLKYAQQVRVLFFGAMSETATARAAIDRETTRMHMLLVSHHNDTRINDHVVSERVR